MARHADALGRRVYELRMPLQHTLRPADGYVAFLEEVAASEATRDRLDAAYEVTLRGLRARYQAYLEATDRLLDEPSVRVIEGILADHERIRAAADLGAAAPRPPGWITAALAGLEASPHRGRTDPCRAVTSQPSPLDQEFAGSPANPPLPRPASRSCRRMPSCVSGRTCRRNRGASACIVT
jgi:hypothetical protein